MVAPSNGFNKIGESSHRSYGQGMGAGVILPKQLLEAATAGKSGDFGHLLQDNYENPLEVSRVGSDRELHQLDRILKLSVDDFTAHARTASSPDELSMYIAKRLMREESPSLLWITMHDIDIAHSGRLFALRRRDSPHRPPLRRVMESGPGGAGIRGQHHPADPAGFWPVTPIQTRVPMASSITAQAAQRPGPRG